MKLSDIKKQLAEAGIVVHLAGVKVNGNTAYTTDKHHGLFTKSGLIKLLGQSL